MRRHVVILEYGSGGSTVLASEMPGKTVFSVDSDRRWARNLQSYLDQAETNSPVHLHHSSIGKTGKWCRPVDHSGFRR
jgi:predicted O-methyltransferase YrrM